MAVKGNKEEPWSHCTLRKIKELESSLTKLSLSGAESEDRE